MSTPPPPLPSAPSPSPEDSGSLGEEKERKGKSSSKNYLLGHLTGSGRSSEQVPTSLDCDKAPGRGILAETAVIAPSL
jgi:hypothetical protein